MTCIALRHASCVCMPALAEMPWLRGLCRLVELTAASPQAIVLKQSGCTRAPNHHLGGTSMLTTAVLNRFALTLFIVAAVSGPALLVA